MSIIENFLNKPVLIQLKNPIIGVVSTSPAEVDGQPCGIAGMAFVESNDGRPNQPFVIQVLSGSIEAVDDVNLQVATLGADAETPVRVLLERENIANISFCVEHRELKKKEPTPKILVPGN